MLDTNKKKLYYLSWTFVLCLWQTTCAQDLCGTKSSCGECIGAHQDCGWCADVQERNASTPIRCYNQTMNSSCQNKINPRSAERKVKDLQFSNRSQSSSFNLVVLRPQELNLQLRTGDPIKVNITFKKILEYPLDFYYLLDLSYSMKDDLNQVQKLGERLVGEIRENITQNVNLGFGTFVDKVLLPYATNQTSVFERICEGDCQRPFGFRHQVTLTDNGSTFREAVEGTKISANIDTPEGGLDALMQIAVCTDLIGWRRDALHVVLFSSDAPSHVAMDGKLAGLYDKNDLSCSMEKEWNSNDYIYSKSKKQDYPSIGQLRKVFLDNNIEIIFAVTNDVYDLYAGLNNILPATVQVLQSDSGNILKVVSDAYNVIRTQFRMENPASHIPDNVDLKVNVLCPQTTVWKRDSFECDDVKVGEEVVFELELTSKSCPSDPNTNDVIPLSFSAVRETVNLTINYICECNCSSFPLAKNSLCNGRGNLECGACECESGTSGSFCQCVTERSTQELEQTCTDPNPLSRVDNEVCNGNGLCECGNCSANCFAGFYGEFCNCSSVGCERDENDQLCGGQEKGTCENCYGDQHCECNSADGWYLNTLTDICDCNDKECIAHPEDTQVCSGRGECECKECECFNNSLIWGGRYCDTCTHPSCSPIVGECSTPIIQACALCVYTKIFATDCDPECRNVNIYARTVDALPDCAACLNSTSRTEDCQPCDSLNEKVFPAISCLFKNDDACNVTYLLGWNINPPTYRVLVKRQNSDEDCPPPIEPLYIILPVTGGILFLGICALIAWKCIVSYWDRKELAEYLLELDKSKWAKTENHLYVGATSHYKNPNFDG